ncbi:unnamed protein product [Effrenium voratum]|uniref:Uncharacterized protein n=1 Tax=Effrenium voratum TaxID=2562239 RepID=A0AA36I4U9_9DINO|nr:unnamed protein product [Effrenium voratum]
MAAEPPAPLLPPPAPGPSLGSALVTVRFASGGVALERRLPEAFSVWELRQLLALELQALPWLLQLLADGELRDQQTLAELPHGGLTLVRRSVQEYSWLPRPKAKAAVQDDPSLPVVEVAFVGNLFNALSQMMRLTKMSSIYGRALRPRCTDGYDMACLEREDGQRVVLQPCHHVPTGTGRRSCQASLVFLTFALDSRASFDKARAEYYRSQELTKTSFVLLGTHQHLHSSRQVSAGEASELARGLGVVYVEVFSNSLRGLQEVLFACLDMRL